MLTQFYPELAASAGFALNTQSAAAEFDYPADERETQASALAALIFPNLQQNKPGL